MLDINKILKTGVVVIVTYFVGWAIVVATVVCIAAHFIGKFW